MGGVSAEGVLVGGVPVAVEVLEGFGATGAVEVLEGFGATGAVAGDVKVDDVSFIAAPPLGLKVEAGS